MTQQTFDSYVLFESVLADELGHLYRAAELAPDGAQRRVWLRVFDADQIPAHEVVESLEEATSIGNSLQETTLVTNPRFFERDGTPAMAWDYVPGQPLARVLERSDDTYSPFSAANALLVVTKLGTALATGLTIEVGGSSLAHGFLHPALIVATNDGQIQVSGFGIAGRLLGLLDNPATADAIHPYLAPEVITSGAISTHADVYSLGAILFRLLTGETLPTQPTDRKSAVREAELADSEQPIPEEIRTVLETALEPAPERRFSSAVELNDALRRLMSDDSFGHEPSTFDLAVLMYQLFRSEIDAEEKLAVAESEIELGPLLAPQVEEIAAVGEVEEVTTPATARSSGKGLWIGIASAVVVVAVAAFFGIRQLWPPVAPAPLPTPTPTAAEIAAQKQVEREQIAAMVDAELSRLMAEKEEEITQELMARQEKIEDLRRQLARATRKRSASAAGPTQEEQRQAEKLRQEIEAAEEEKKRREAELAEQQRKAEEEARLAREAALAAAQAAPPAEVPTDAIAPQQAETAEVNTPIPPSPTPPPTPTASVPQGEPDTTTRRADGVVTKPVKISGPAPVYTDAASRRRIGGEVVLQVHVDAKGMVEEIEVLQGLPMGLTKEATNAVKRWKFQPATQNGLPVSAVIELRINFSPP